MTASLTRSFLTLGRSVEFVRAVSDALLPLSAQALEPSVCETVTSHDVSEVIDRIKQETPTFLLVDFQWGLTTDADIDASQVGLQRLRAALVQGNYPPPSLSLVVGIRREVTPGPSAPVVVVFADDPSVPFLQVALQIGANWVWPSRTSMARLDEVVLRLAEVQNQQEERRPRLMVVENGSADIQTMRATLDDIFDLSFVGVEETSAMNLAITPQMTFEFLETKGPFDAIVVDLALTDPAEDDAREHFGSEEAAVVTFMGERPEIQTAKLRSDFAGVVIVNGLLARNNEARVMVMSNYIHSAAIMGQINLALGQGMERVAFFDKKHGGYEGLRRELLRELKSPGRSRVATD